MICPAARWLEARYEAAAAALDAVRRGETLSDSEGAVLKEARIRAGWSSPAFCGAPRAAWVVVGAGGAAGREGAPVTVTLGTFNPLNVECPFCGNPPGMKCGSVSGWSRKPHLRRVKLALQLAAHADPSLDPWFKMRNQCQLCGTPGLPQRHRVVDAIAGCLEAGEGETDVAADMGVSLDAVMAVQAWAIRWPGAWR